MDEATLERMLDNLPQAFIGVVTGVVRGQEWQYKDGLACLNAIAAALDEYDAKRTEIKRRLGWE